jgi:hypothetical protein
LILIEEVIFIAFPDTLYAAFLAVRIAAKDNAFFNTSSVAGGVSPGVSIY